MVTVTQVPGVLSPAECTRLLDRLRPLPRHTLAGPMTSVGPMLAPTEAWVHGPELDAYFRESAVVAAEATAAVPDLEPRLHTLLTRLTGRPSERMRHADGRRYGLVVLRELPPGASGPAHNDAYRPEPAFADRDQQCDTPERWSFYLHVGEPEGGGSLELEGPSGTWTPTPAPSLGGVTFFCASAVVHRISTVTGARSRFTLGGFGGFGGGRFLTWA